ncbi:Deuterolysin metalloprotease family-domain-containing protein [Phyllosticta citriasiana]|uniref:Deuterolysin metalloprotease family-domain-containing protein n=1 Tax=Phyllosticta citriasiana TaxID=595635 RepID=UPI0030FD432D
MKFFKCFAPAILASIASGAIISFNRDSHLGVVLELANHTEIRAIVTNNGPDSLNLFKKGNFLDSAAVEKAEIHSADAQVPFEGVRLRSVITGLGPSSFLNLPPGQSHEVTFDIAEMYALHGKEYDVLSRGVISYAEGDSFELAGAVPYESNRIRISVDPHRARQKRDEFHGKAQKLKKRSVLERCPPGPQKDTVLRALDACAKLSQEAQRAASTGDSKQFAKYFKDPSPEMRKAVAGVYAKVAAECGKLDGGETRIHCDDGFEYCDGLTLAYTSPSTGLQVYCPAYYADDFPDLTKECHGQDRATTTLHEMTHLDAVAGTIDIGYGYRTTESLRPKQAIANADTYSLYANGLWSGCWVF